MRETVRRRRRLAAFAVLGAIVLVGAAYGSTYTSLFGASTIRVSGATRLSDARIQRLAGIGPGTNVFHLDTARAASRIERDPWVADATVSRDLPSTITVDVQERTPVALAPDGRVLSSDGVVLPGALSGELPTLRATVGELSADDEGDALAAVGALAPVVRDQVAAVLVDPSHEVTLVLRDGVLARFGVAGDEAAKAVAVRAVLRWADEQGASLATVDVSVPSAPAATLKDGTTVTP